MKLSGPGWVGFCFSPKVILALSKLEVCSTVEKSISVIHYIEERRKIVTIVNMINIEKE